VISTDSPLIADNGVPKVGVRPGAAPTTKLKELVDAVAPFASVTVAVIAKVPD
jgi:hypothetical protein